MEDTKIINPSKETPGRGYKRICAYRQCARWAPKGWTTCDGHHTAGRSLTQVRQQARQATRA